MNAAKKPARYVLSSLALLAACGPDNLAVEDAGDPRPAVTEVRKGILRLPSGPQEIQYEVRNGLAFLEDDILLGTADEVQGKGASEAAGFTPQAAGRGSGWRQFDVGSLWPGGQVAYAFGPGIDAPTQALIQVSLALMSGQTPLRFQARTSQTDYVEFQDTGAGCSSDSVGRKGGKQVVNLGPGCKAPSVIIHEVGHVAGLYHEQTRADRDSHVRIVTENIQAGKEHNFQKYSRGLDLDGYDYASIMHYSATAFSKNGLPTIMRRDGQPLPPRAQTLSPGDARALTEMYMAQPVASLAEVGSRWVRLTNSFLGGPRSLDTYSNGANDPFMGATGGYGGQYWRLTSLGGGWYRLTNSFLGEGRALDTYPIGDNKPVMATSGSYSGQYWKLTPFGDRCFRLSNMFLGDGRSLDTYGNGSNAPFMATSGNYSGQCWRLTVL